MRTSNSKVYFKYLIQATKPEMAYDEDIPLDEWQKKARVQLEKLLGLPLISCEADFTVLKKTSKTGYTQMDFEFQSEPGYFVPCSFLIPDGIEKPLPTVICLQGHSTGAHLSLGIPKFPGDENSIAGNRDYAVRAVQEGFCAIAMEQRYMGSCGQSETGKPACLTDGVSLPSVLLGRTAIGERVWDIMRLIDVMEKELFEYVDKERIICMGNSGGGTATFYTSCMDDRIYLSMPSCSVCTYEASIIALRHCDCNYIPGIRKYFNMGDLGCLIAPRRLVMVNGIEDSIFPIKGAEESFDIIKKAYKKAGKEELCHMVKGKGGHQFYPDDAWPVVKSIL